MGVKSGVVFCCNFVRLSFLIRDVIRVWVRVFFVFIFLLVGIVLLGWFFFCNRR